MPAVEILPRAEDDLFKIWDYIARDNPEAADAFVRRVHEMYELAAENPSMGRSREELARRLRSLPVGNYVIYYRPLEETAGIKVVRVLHGAQDVQDSLFE